MNSFWSKTMKSPLAVVGVGRKRAVDVSQQIARLVVVATDDVGHPRAVAGVAVSSSVTKAWPAAKSATSLMLASGTPMLRRIWRLPRR